MIYKLSPNIVPILLALCLTGCHAPRVLCDPSLVKRQLMCRMGVATQTVAPCQEIIPAGVVLDDGISEGEAVATALSNNSAYQATLATLGAAGGDAIQANLIANPQLLVYFPTDTKEGQYTLFAPIESYFLRPLRVKVANREYCRIGEQLVQNGLNLARDVRIAYTDLALAQEQSQLAGEALELRENIVDLTKKRLNDGDISELETIAASVDQLNAKANQSVQSQAVGIAEARLATLVGLTQLSTRLSSEPMTPPTILDTNEDVLIAQALACRPDYHAARWAVAAASDRSRLSRFLFWRIDGVLDVRSDPGRTGGGLRADIPIFNRNQGGVLRADWELNAAMHNRDAIHDQIVADVRISSRQLAQAQANLVVLRDEIAPALKDALEIARKGFADGGTDYLLVLQTTSQYLANRALILDQTAACHRAVAELERSVGRNLAAGYVDILALAEASLPPEDAKELEAFESAHVMVATRVMEPQLAN